MNPKIYSPAFPPQLTQDQFGRIVAPISGMTILDYAAIQIYANNAEQLGTDEAVKLAKSLIDELYKIQSEENLNNVIDFTESK